MSLLLSLRSELLKTKRTASFYLTLIAGACGPLMSLLDLLLDGINPDDRNTILNKIFTTKFQMTSFMLLPMFIVLICTLLPQIEYKNHTWKQALTSPQAKSTLYLVKFLNVHLLILGFLATNQLGMLLVAVVLHFTQPALNVLNQPVNGHDILMTVINGYMVLLALCSIQFWIGIRFKNFIAPIAIGLCLWFAGSLLLLNSESPIAPYFPYSFHVHASFPKYSAQLPAIRWTSLAYAVLFFGIGLWDFKRRKMDR